jgi:hypothetical protein
MLSKRGFDGHPLDGRGRPTSPWPSKGPYHALSYPVVNNKRQEVFVVGGIKHLSDFFVVLKTWK